MTILRLSQPGELDTSTFWWRPRGMDSSFWTNLGPHLNGFGPVQSQAIDLVRVAAAVYLTDRTTPRGGGLGDHWCRTLDVTVEVSDPDRWEPLSYALSSLCTFLSGDDWAFTFVGDDGSRPQASGTPEPVPVVSLLSGGMDSFCGALLAHRTFDTAPLVVSHWDSNGVSAAQTAALRGFGRLTGARPMSAKVRLGRRELQLRGGGTFLKELSSRSRSLLFLALGVAVAAPRSAQLWIPENGFLSLNLPLAAERRSSLSTRTTHPQLLQTFNDILRALDLDVQVSNPFESHTKGDMAREVHQIYGEKGIRELANTASCAKPDFKHPNRQCGVCYACIVRRAAFAAAETVDRTPYLEEELTGEARVQWLNGDRRLAYEAIQYAVAREFDLGDILELGLPDRYKASDALALAKRGLAELALVDIP